MDLGLAGRACAVTGATGSLGAEVARQLRAEGAQVLEADVDLTAADAGARILIAAEDRLGGLDVLVNAAAPPPTEAGDWDVRFELDVMAPLRTMRAVAPAMAARGWGRIVNVPSTVGRAPGAPAASSVTSAAELALSRLFADRYARSGVLVNAVCPDPAASPAATAATVVLLCSERASYVNGAAWPVAGGPAAA